MVCISLTKTRVALSNRAAIRSADIAAVAERRDREKVRQTQMKVRLHPVQTVFKRGAMDLENELFLATRHELCHHGSKDQKPRDSFEDGNDARRAHRQHVAIADRRCGHN